MNVKGIKLWAITATVIAIIAIGVSYQLRNTVRAQTKAMSSSPQTMGIEEMRQCNAELKTLQTNIQKLKKDFADLEIEIKRQKGIK